MILGLDMGGTNVDALLIKDGKIVKKVTKEIESDDAFKTIFTTIESLIKAVDLKKITTINLSTTIATNAILLNKLANIALIVQTGPGLTKEYFKVAAKTFFISGYTDHRGEVTKDYQKEEIETIKKELKKNNITNLAIVSKFSTRNNSTEMNLKNIFKRDVENITLGHQMSGKLNFPRRFKTSYLNASIKPLFKKFYDNILTAFEGLGITCPLNILKADGGIIPLKEALKLPVESIFSGPSASLMGMLALSKTKKDALLLDIGGTTTDIFFLKKGEPLFLRAGIEIKGNKTLIRALYSKSLPLGGDSLIKMVKNEVKIGPERLDKALVFGGKYLTVTDILFYLTKKTFPYRSLVVKELAKLSVSLKLTNDDLAELIKAKFLSKIKKAVNLELSLINNKLVYKIAELLKGETLVPEEMIVVGAPARSFKKGLEESFKIPVIIPPNYEVANALGAALAKPTTALSMLVNTKRRKMSIPELSIYRNVDFNYSLKEARRYLLKELLKEALRLGADKEDLELEIIEEEQFNMVEGFYTSGKNMRLKAQVKPGLRKESEFINVG